MTDWIIHVIATWDWIGVAFLMFLENLFPIPSELVLPTAGAVAATKHASLFGVIFGSVVGSVLGTLPFYYLGRWINLNHVKHLAARYGRALTVTPRDVDRVERWFERHGAMAVMVGRLLPTVRSLISLPAGISCMPLPRFLIFTIAGTLAWNILLIVIGWSAGPDSSLIHLWSGPVGNIILFGAAIAYLYRVATFRRTVRKHEQQAAARPEGSTGR